MAEVEECWKFMEREFLDRLYEEYDTSRKNIDLTYEGGKNRVSEPCHLLYYYFK